ncbi:LuxR C-terminal-related transcriptional regulator [Promicromonospora soli]
MGLTDPDQQALIGQARAAHREHRYDAAYDTLRAARELGALDPEDLHRLADAAWWLGLVPECLRLTELAHRDFLATGHLDQAAMQALDMGGMLALRGEPALASAWLNRARRLLEELPVGPAHGTLWYVDLSFALEEGRLDEASRTAEELRRLGREHGQDAYVALGHLGQGLVLLRRGRVTDAFGQMDEAMLLVFGGQVEPEWAGHIACTIVTACLDVADLNRARLCSEAAYRWLEDFEHAVMFTGVCRAHEVDLLVVEGQWTAAEHKADLVVRDLAELNVEAVGEVEYQRGECHRLRGEYDAADAAYERAAALGCEPQPGAALLALARGDVAAAWEAVCDAAARASTDPFRSARLLRALVEIGVAARRLDAAGSAAARLHDLAAAFGTPGFLAWSAHCDGVVALASGDATEALDPLMRASSGFRRMRAWCDAAAADLLLSDVHAALGNAAKAEQYRDSSAAVSHRLGIPDAAPRPRSELDGVLTAREAEILARVSTGAANREVAASLSISEATVRRHLANIYLKLDVRTRTAAAAWAHRHGLVPGARA